MTEVIKLNAELKEANGTGAAKHARRNEKVPGIIYGGAEQTMITIPLNELQREYYKGNFFSKLTEIKLGKKTITAIPREVQLDPVKDLPVHVDLQEVKADTKVKVSIHVKVVNEDKCPGVKRGGVLNVVHRSINCLCSPREIPSFIEVDVSGLEIGKNLHIQDIKLPKGTNPIDSSNFTLVSIAGRGATAAKTTEETQEA